MTYTLWNMNKLINMKCTTFHVFIYFNVLINSLFLYILIFLHYIFIFIFISLYSQTSSLGTTQSSIVEISFADFSKNRHPRHADRRKQSQSLSEQSASSNSLSIAPYWIDKPSNVCCELTPFSLLAWNEELSRHEMPCIL